MPTKAELEQAAELTQTAKARILVYLREHHGFFPFTSELASNCGIQRTYVRMALEKLIREGTIGEESVSERVNGRSVSCKAFVLYEADCGPRERRAIVLSHYYSQTVNSRGSDSHPWRNETLACPLCARIRETFNSEWGIAKDNKQGRQVPSHRTAHMTRSNMVQLPLGRKARATGL